MGNGGILATWKARVLTSSCSSSCWASGLRVSKTFLFICSSNFIPVSRYLYFSYGTCYHLVLWKGVLKHHTQALETAASAFSITAGRGERDSILHGSFRSPHYVGADVYHAHTRAHTHIHTHPSSTIQPQPACHQHGRPWWQIGAATGIFSFFFFSLPPPTEPFFPSLGIKRSNDVPLQNSISQFS